MNRVIFLWFLFLIVIDAHATTDNIAPEARIEVSSFLGPSFRGDFVSDGIIGIDDEGEWACKGEVTSWGDIKFPWIKLTWNKERIINRIVLYDRPNKVDNIAGGRLLFSDGSEIWVHQIPPDGTGKSIEFPTKKIDWVKFVVTDGTGKDLGFSEIEVFSAPEDAKDYVALVDPYTETNRGRYFFFVTGSRPFGMVTSAPMTRNKNQNGGGYNYNETEVLGFEQIHTWMMSGIEVMPATKKEDPLLGEAGWKSRFNHDDEIVQPGYHRLMLQNNKIWVEQTATERVSFYKIRYTKESDARIIINLFGPTGNASMQDGKIRRIGNDEIVGSVNTTDRFWGGPKDVEVFFAIKLDKPFDNLEAWVGNNYESNVDSVSNRSLRIAPHYRFKKNSVVKLKVAISYTSVENALNNLNTELPGWDFEKVAADTRNIWNTELSKIDVKGGTIGQRVKFYTDLWHVLLGRQKINDVSGDYPDRTEGVVKDKFTDAVFKIKTVPKNPDGSLRFNMYNSDAWWLTHWNLNVLWGLAWPEVMDEMSASMIEYANNGYLLPRGPCGGGYSYIMTSSPATNLIVSTFMKGLLTKQTAENAYKVIKQNSLPGGMLGPAEDISFYTKNGWWPENVGIGIEASFQDWGISQMAYKLGKKKDYKFFSERSKNWQKNFNSDQKLLFPKDRKGNFMTLDPLSGLGWVEANAWQGTWGVSQDIAGLARLMGGNDTLCKMLNYAFEQSASTDFVYGYSNGYISYANQPGCSDAHVFSYAGKPWLTQYWVRRVQDQVYGRGTPDLGYGGHDEDEGQMGAISALMSIGLFNIQGSEAIHPVYEMTSPIFDEITIKLDKKYYHGEKFVIITHNNSYDNRFIQKATLNGAPWNKFWFSHDVFEKGGELELWLGSEANQDWGIGGSPPEINNVANKK